MKATTWSRRGDAASRPCPLLEDLEAWADDPVLPADDVDEWKAAALALKQDYGSDKACELVMRMALRLEEARNRERYIEDLIGFAQDADDVLRMMAELGLSPASIAKLTELREGLR